jgi:asparagine synthase (glutamine-hydrolysing)
LSGIVGICERDGAPVDPGLLRALTDFLAYRGPDGQEVWSQGAVGFGHTMLRTTYEAENERQPASLDARFWITADARIDCRDELMRKLEDAGCRVSRTITDPELILNAYAAWNEGCVQHLRGDFSFAIWDHRERELFCARDHFGIKPFYYAEIGETVVFSNTLNCVRLHPAVPDDLNDDAVLDFLIIGLNCDNSSTTFQAVRRLPPAHCMKVSAAGIHVRRYWSLPTEGRIRYRRAKEYIEHFQSLLREAVADRLRTDRAGIFLSGGLDSSSIAATARQVRPAASGAADLRAYTVVYESLIPDQEGPMAREVANFLRLPISFVALDDLKPFEPWDRPEAVWPEPIEDPYFCGTRAEFGIVAQHSRVVLSGEGGDDLMAFEMWPYICDSIRRRDWRALQTETRQFLRVRRFPWRGLVRRMQRIFGRGPLAPVAPEWISPRWTQAIDPTNRWKVRTAAPAAHVHPILPKAHAALAQPLWTLLFEVNDPGFTRFAVEVRHPFLDLRIAEYLLAIPPFPWLFEKDLLRRATSGLLPERIRTRPKTPLIQDPLVAHLKRGDDLAVGSSAWSDEMNRYVERTKLGSVSRETSSERACVGVRPLCLNFWLRAIRCDRYNSLGDLVGVETRNG